MKRKTRRLAVAALVIFNFVTVPVVIAQDEAPNYAEYTLTGDWGGLREEWRRKGVAVDLGYKLDMLRVTGGGLRSGGRPIGHFDLKVAADLDKLLGWDGASALVNFIYDSGGKTNRDYVGSLLGTSNVEVPVTTHRFFQAWIEQTFLDGKLGVLAGLYPIDSEFQTVESAGIFVQPPYGAAPDIALTRGPSLFNNPALGLRAKWQSKESGLYAMGAVLDGIPGDPANPQGTHIRFQQGDGAMQIAEFGYRPPTGAGGTSQAEPAERFGKFAVGAWRYTARVNDLVDVDAAGNPVPRRSSGWYALAEHTLWRWALGNLAGFVRFGATDGDSTAIEKFYNVGVRVRGLIPGREDDVLGIAHTHAGIGEKFRTSQAANGIAATSAESATEITYRAQVAKWLTVQPLIQHYRNPGADSAVRNATVVGVRVELAL